MNTQKILTALKKAKPNQNVKYKAKNGKTYDITSTMQKRLNNLDKNLKNAEKENGFIGKAWSGFKNLTGFGDSSDKVRELQKSGRKLLAQFTSNNKNKAKVFEQLTGAKYNAQNLEKFIKGQIKLKSEFALKD